MASRIDISLQTEQKLAEQIVRFTYDPLGFVMFAYPWGVKGTQLEKKKGPEEWQRVLLTSLGERCKDNAFLKANDMQYEAVRFARASGHGVGKSALVAWIIQWFMSTRPDGRGTVTASTGTQLETRTWPELAKWHEMLINKHWFTWTASSYYFALYPEEKRKNYMITAATVSEHNTEAFAGLHNEMSAVLIIFDEASGVHEKVYEVAEGALTDGEPFAFYFGNPTKPDGPFFEIFDKHQDLYDTAHIDSRTVSHTNKNVIADMVKKWGEDSDEFRVRVTGRFPEKSYSGFIPPHIVVESQERMNFHDNGASLILGCDIARFGDDTNVVCPRRGSDARSLDWLAWKGQDTIVGAERIADYANKYKPDMIVIECVGPGIGVIDQLKHWKFRVNEFYPGAKSGRPGFRNKRMDIWDAMSKWLITIGCIPPQYSELYNDLVGIQYILDKVSGLQRMEEKERMKSRGLPSPDWADALALTFAVDIPRRDSKLRAGRTIPGHSDRAVMDYDEFNLGDNHASLYA